MSAPTDGPAAAADLPTTGSRTAHARTADSPPNADSASADSPNADLPAADLPAADAQAEFREFFERHHVELARLAHLLLGSSDGADDLAADALVAVWHRWDRVRVAEHPAAYARGVLANLARSRIRSLVRERRRVALFSSERSDRVDDPDVSAVVDVQAALVRLPFRKRACVVLRHAFDLSERDTARTLGISVGTVKSQTSRGIAELERLLGPPDDDTERPAAGTQAQAQAQPSAQETVRGLRPGRVGHAGHPGGNG